MEKALSSAGSNPNQPRAPRIRRWLVTLLIIVAAIAVSIPLLTRWFLLRTDYATGFTKADFQKVKPGDSLSTVLDRLKAPLNFAIISQRHDDSRFKPQYSDDISTLSKWSNDISSLIILRYSAPRVPGGSFHAYEVWINKGVVQELRVYNYWD